MSLSEIYESSSKKRIVFYSDLMDLGLHVSMLTGDTEACAKGRPRVSKRTKSVLMFVSLRLCVLWEHAQELPNS